MNRILMITVIFLLACTAVYSQQAAQGGSNPPTSNQTKQNAQQYLDQAKSNLEEFLSVLADLKDRNGSNRDAYTFNRLKRDIDFLETNIRSEEGKIKASLDRGTKVNTEVIGRYENFIKQHQEKVEELENFVSN